MIRMGTRETKFEVDQAYPRPGDAGPKLQTIRSRWVKKLKRMNLSQLTLALPQITFSHPLIQPTILVFR